MIGWLKELDELLRGSKTEAELLAQGASHLRLRPYAVASVALGLVYGIFMGLYAVLSREDPCYMQMVATAVKVPALFFLTLVVTFPSLYVFSALLGLRLPPLDTLRVVMAAIAVNLTVLASFGPITGFFTLSTTSYAFMKLLNVFFFAVSGVIGLGFLLSMLRRLEGKRDPAPDQESAAGERVQLSNSAGEASPQGCLLFLTSPARHATARTVFTVWLFLYAAVGAQMGWVLRPFIGHPDMEFTWFRSREANVFIDILRTLERLLGS